LEVSALSPHLLQNSSLIFGQATPLQLLGWLLPRSLPDCWPVPLAMDLESMPDTKSLLQLELDELLLVALGAVPGGLLRWQVALHLQDQHLLVNTLGAALLGCLAALPENYRCRLLVGIGFCGSLTTFSGWMWAATKQISSGDWLVALGFIGCTLGLGLGAGLLGYSCGKSIHLIKKILS